MDKGNLSAWKKEEGDALSVGQVLCEIETVRQGAKGDTIAS